LLVIDYKTTARAEDPETSHTVKLRSNSAYPVFACTSDGERAWKDLQLPLYVLHAAERMKVGHDAIEAAYFALPNAVSDTGLMAWTGLDARLVDEAHACAQRIAERVAAGVFWPPAGEFDGDDAAHGLFFDSIERHMDPDWKKLLQDRAAAWDRRPAATGGGRD
jgi:hypothetical protein